MGAGLGGGSSDCAATLRWFYDEYHLNPDLPIKIGQALKFGSDVPYCLFGRTAIARSRGEDLQFISLKLPEYILIVTPDIFVSTKEIFTSFDQDENKESKYEKTDFSQNIYGLMENDLEHVTFDRYPCLKEIKSYLEKFGFEKVRMSGSGPTLFALTDDYRLGSFVLNSTACIILNILQVLIKSSDRRFPMEIELFQTMSQKDIERCFRQLRWKDYRTFLTINLSILLLIFGIWLFLLQNYWYLGILFVIIGIYGLLYLPRHRIAQMVSQHQGLALDREMQYQINKQKIRVIYGKSIITEINIDDHVKVLYLPDYIYVKREGQWAIIKNDNLSEEQMNKIKELWRNYGNQI
jgi:hypothetical protein